VERSADPIAATEEGTPWSVPSGPAERDPRSRLAGILERAEPHVDRLDGRMLAFRCEREPGEVVALLLVQSLGRGFLEIDLGDAIPDGGASLVPVERELIPLGFQFPDPR
jgi:hypothetical protein